MGRKKRPAAAAFNNNGAAQQPPPAHHHHHLPPPPPMFDAYGRPLPPMPTTTAAHQPPPSPHPHHNLPDGTAGKRQRADNNNNNTATTAANSESGERTTYPVKKYRPDTYYKTIEAFQKYTKSHRMDATFVKWTSGGGATAEKPHVYGIRISGSFLSWGRGKTRDAAIDAAVRAAFALVAAHGYNEFPLTEDCFTEEPVVVLAPIPPPPPPPMMPPLPPGLPPPSSFGGLPPPPSGAPPNFLPPPPADGLLIPQPLAPKVDVAVASAVGGAAGISSLDGTAGVLPSAINLKPIQSVAIGTTSTAAASTTTTAAATSNSKKDTKTKNKLVFQGEDVDESGEELSMEELRMRTPKYWKETVKALERRKEVLVSLDTEASSATATSTAAA